MNFELTTNDYVDSTTYDQRLILSDVDASSQYTNNFSTGQYLFLFIFSKKKN